MSMGLETHEHSPLCIDAQKMNIGCHACGRLSCASLLPTCHALCVRLNHVCGEDSIAGCDRCSHLCHRTNDDVRCMFFGRDRGVGWNADAQQLMDTQSGTGGSLPHYNQVVWSFKHRRDGTQDKRLVDVDGVSFAVGVGDPGRSRNDEYNNCLIDSLRQCIGITADRIVELRRQVRRDLQRDFCNAAGRARVTHDSYLDVESHWRTILQSFFQHAFPLPQSQHAFPLPQSCEVNDYCVIALHADSDGGNGNVNGDLRAPYRCIILNWGDRHFEPCLPLRTQSASSSSA